MKRMKRSITKRYGNCAQCGRRGLMTLRTRSKLSQADIEIIFASEFTLVDYGANVNYCNDECYRKYRT